MIEQITERRYKDASAIIESLKGVSLESIANSGLTEFTKSFIINDAGIPSTKSELLTVVDKSIKLNLNYCIRPKWTLLNYIFGNFDSRSMREIAKKTEIFTFYTFYTEPVLDICNDDSFVSVPRTAIEDIINQVNEDIHSKLITDTTSLKVKNFFLQIFRFKYGESTEISLDMSVPYSFVRLFLEDKGYGDILGLFAEAGVNDDNEEIELKNIIKIVSGKLKGTSLKSAENGSETKTEKVVVTLTKDKPVQEEYKAPQQSSPEASESDSASTGETENGGISSEFEIKEEEKADHLRFHFKEDELKSIAKKVFKGNKYVMQDALLEIEKLKNWREATEYLKAVFINNKVELGDKMVILFVDVLNDYFEKR